MDRCIPALRSPERPPASFSYETNILTAARGGYGRVDTWRQTTCKRNDIFENPTGRQSEARKKSIAVFFLFSTLIAFAEDGTVLRKSILLYPNTRAYSVAFYPQGRRFLVGSGSIESYDFENRTIASSPISGDSGGDEEQVTSLLVTPDGKSLISSSYKGDIKIWDIAGGSLRKSLRGHTKSASAGAFLGDLKL